MMAGNLSVGQRKWILKEYWKTENAERVRTAWVQAFNTPASYAIYCILTFGPLCIIKILTKFFVIVTQYCNKFVVRFGAIQ